MATNAQIGAGTLVQAGNGASPEVFTTVTEVQTVPPIGEQKEEIEVTHLNSTAKEYIGGLPDGSTFDLAVNYVTGDTTHEALLVDYAADTARNFKMTFVGGDVFLYTTRILGWNVEGGPNDKITLTFNCKITGSVTLPS